MKMTELLKQWLRENRQVPEDADDAAYKKAAAEALVSEDLTHDKFVELQRDPDAEKATGLHKTLQAMTESMIQVVEAIKTIQQSQTAAKKPEKIATSKVTPDMVVGDGESEEPLKADVKRVDKMYSTSRSELRYPQFTRANHSHPMAGRLVREEWEGGGRTIEAPSQLDRAVSGAFAKHMIFGPAIARGLLPDHVITDHDRELLKYAVHEMPWRGDFGEMAPGTLRNREVINRGLTEEERNYMLRSTKDQPPVWTKDTLAVSDEAAHATQGMELVPIVFDDDVITKPLHHSDFFPRVNLKTITRGRRIEGAVLDNVTLAWANTETTAITLDDTDAFVAAFDTNIHPITGAIRIGLDFLSDTPVNFGDHVTTEFGEQLAFELDKAIVAGNGTTAPTGIHDQGTAVTFGNEWTYGDLVALMFTVDRAHQRSGDNNRICWGGQESSYADIRALATGVTGDTRPVFGMDVQAYSILGHPFLTNAAYGVSELNYVNLAHYRMYRRLGLTARVTDQGSTLFLANHLLITVRARFGGQLERTNYCAYTADGAA